MFLASQRKTASPEPAELQELFSQCEFIISADGALLIRLHNGTLTSEHLADIIELLGSSEVCEGLEEVVFDFREVIEVGPQWTLPFAMLIEFARRVDARCRLVELMGQPAAAANLYRRNADLGRLLAA